jgi:hypothetical protein
MIIIKIFGGLGNQMFQYSFGKALSIMLKRKLIIDKSYFEPQNYPFDLHPYYPYKLDLYNIKDDFAPRMISTYQNIIQKKNIYSYLNPLFLKYFENVPVFFNKDNFLNDDMKKTKTAFLTGFWQNDVLKEKHRDIITKSLTLKEISKNSKELLKKIKDSNSVSIHFRKGDYISNPIFKKVYANCDLSYYDSAIKKIKGQVNNPQFYLFTDNQKWLETNFKLKNNMHMIDKSIYDHEQQFLFSKCKHSIIANSSFSWWGAWLNDFYNKLVIRPQNWFNDPNRKNDIYFPNKWIKIPN